MKNETQNSTQFLKKAYQGTSKKFYLPYLVICFLVTVYSYRLCKDFLEFRAEITAEQRDAPKVNLSQRDINFYKESFPGASEAEIKRMVSHTQRIANERAVGQQTQQYFGDKNRFEE